MSIQMQIICIAFKIHIQKVKINESPRRTIHIFFFPKQFLHTIFAYFKSAENKYFTLQNASITDALYSKVHLYIAPCIIQFTKQ